MELKLQLGVVMLLIQVSYALWQRVTVRKGQTLILSCPITNAHKTNVDWKTPEGYVMFFNHNRALRNKRYSIIKLSESEFTISISNVTFKDGGNYTCSQYDHHTTERKVEVTVFDNPKMTVTKHEGKFIIKCTAEGNHHPPQISWKLDNGPEILTHAQVQQEDKKYVSMAMLNVQSVENRVTVKCLLRHPALLSQPLMNFIKIGRDCWTSVSETTGELSHNTTEGNSTGNINDPRIQTGSRGSSSLLVFLVTFLILCLLVVVIFFAIKLRRAHIAWKRVFIVTENEDSDPSEESSKSKSSQEEKNVQGQRRRGSKLEYKGETKSSTQRVISSMVLDKDVKEIAEAYLEKLSTTPVITVPAYSTMTPSRPVTKDAGTISGLTLCDTNQITSIVTRVGQKERGKHTVFQHPASIEISPLYEGVDFYTSITRAALVSSTPTFRGTLDPVEKSPIRWS
ncbi:cytotoxic and regulatory T-cell molecule isoform X1 [Lates japonicus]|uniref:Cytotoxic and regulatory T-cell molecule isoform X1 n=1 Tax=Lates japonicus TaxID=270547 RepID=A0AAD3QXH1_LATJO|nr:cytotoxic and regulatory T-cell molecule isoform X1 [Lates japonicus]